MPRKAKKKQQSDHHNINKQRVCNASHNKRVRSAGSLGSNESPFKKAKDSSLIVSPNVFQLLDGYIPENSGTDSDIGKSNDNNICTSNNKNRSVLARQSINMSDEDDNTDILLNRVLNNIGKLSNKLDTSNLKVKEFETRMTTLENCMSSIDVKLDINNALITSVEQSVAYPPERCIILSSVQYNVGENAALNVDKILEVGLHIDIKCVRAKRLNGIGDNGFYVSNNIIAELRSIEDRICVLRLKKRLQQAEDEMLRRVFIRGAKSRLEANYDQHIRHISGNQNDPQRHHMQAQHMRHNTQGQYGEAIRNGNQIKSAYGEQQTFNPHFMRRSNTSNYPPYQRHQYNHQQNYNSHSQPPMQGRRPFIPDEQHRKMQLEQTRRTQPADIQNGHTQLEQIRHRPTELSSTTQPMQNMPSEHSSPRQHHTPPTSTTASVNITPQISTGSPGTAAPVTQQQQMDIATTSPQSANPIHSQQLPQAPHHIPTGPSASNTVAPTPTQHVIDGRPHQQNQIDTQVANTNMSQIPPGIRGTWPTNSGAMHMNQGPYVQLAQHGQHFPGAHHAQLNQQQAVRSDAPFSQNHSSNLHVQHPPQYMNYDHNITNNQVMVPHAQNYIVQNGVMSNQQELHPGFVDPEQVEQRTLTYEQL